MTNLHDPDDSLVGRVLDGRYQVQRILGVGGMGAVYQGKHELLGTPVAIKVMQSDQPKAAERFLAEARRTFRLDHPNCVRVTDAGVADGTLLYLVMELLEGRTLGEELDNDGRLEPNRVAHIGAQVAAAISCAHDLGYVHRDLKPDNIMLLHRGDDPDFVKVLDFGLAKLTDEAKLSGKHSVMSFTRNGMVFGTPHYMSPEQAQGHRLDPRSDLYSLGVVLYEALAGGPPFDSDSEVEVLIAHVQTPPPPVSDYCNLPAKLDALVMSLLAKRREDRPGSAAQLAIELENAKGVAPVRPSGVRPSVAASETLALPSDVSGQLPQVAGDAARATAPTRQVTPSRPRQPSVVRDTFMMPKTKRGPIVGIAIVMLILATGVTVWALVGGSDGEEQEVAIDAAPVVIDAVAKPTKAIDAAIAKAATDAAVVQAAIDAGTKAPEQTAKQRKAETLYKQAKAAMAAGRGELSYLPKLQAAYKLDRRNSKIRKALIKALLGSSDPAQKALGCKMIRRQKKRFEQAGCKGNEAP